MRYNLDDITANITDWILMYKAAGTVYDISFPEKSETGHYTIKLKSVSGDTSWHLDRSIHRNKIMRTLSKDFPELLPLCRNQRLNEIGI